MRGVQVPGLLPNWMAWHMPFHEVVEVPEDLTLANGSIAVLTWSPKLDNIRRKSICSKVAIVVAGACVRMRICELLIRSCKGLPLS